MNPGIPYDEAKDFTGLTDDQLEALRGAVSRTTPLPVELVICGAPTCDEGLYKMYWRETEHASHNGNRSHRD